MKSHSVSHCYPLGYKKTNLTQLKNVDPSNSFFFQKSAWETESQDVVALWIQLKIFTILSIVISLK